MTVLVDVERCSLQVLATAAASFAHVLSYPVAEDGELRLGTFSVSLCGGAYLLNGRDV